MPNIPQYDAGNVALRPTETGIEATAAAARRVGSFYNQLAGATQELGHETANLGAMRGNITAELGRKLGQDIIAGGEVALKYQEHKEISHGAVAYAGALAKFNKDWNERISPDNLKDPNDPTVGPKFLSELEPQLQKLKDTFFTEKGQEWADAHGNAIRNSFYHQTTADMATLAGQATVLNQRQTLNSLSSVVHDNPEKLAETLDLWKSGLTGAVSTSPNLKGVVGQKILSEELQKGNEALVKSAAIGSLKKPPFTVPEIFKDPKGPYSQYINAAELDMFEKTARYYANIDKSEKRSDQVQFEHAQRTDFSAKAIDLEKSTFPKKAGEKPVLPDNYWDEVRKLSDHPGAKYDIGQLHQLENHGNQITAALSRPEPLGRVSHATTQEIFNAMRETDPDKMDSVAFKKRIDEAYGTGKINKDDYNTLNVELENRSTPAGRALTAERNRFLNRFELTVDSQRTAALPGKSALGQQKMYELEQDLMRAEKRMPAGVSPHELYEPKSPHYFGKPENILKYRASKADIAKYDNDLLRGTVTPPAAPKEAPKPPGNIPADARLTPDGRWISIFNGKPVEWRRVEPGRPQVPTSQ